MTTWSMVTVLTCAHLALASSEGKLPVKRPLHQHPTLVRMFEENNRWREQNGLAPQKVSPRLTLLAQKHAEWMASNSSFVHNYEHGYPEIIYWNARSVNGAFIGWMNSGPHRGIILSGSTHMGYGYAVSASGQTYWCGVFGNMRDEKPSGTEGNPEFRTVSR